MNFVWNANCETNECTLPPALSETFPSLPAALSGSSWQLPGRKPIKNNSDICLTAGCIHSGMCLVSGATIYLALYSRGGVRLSPLVLPTIPALDNRQNWWNDNRQGKTEVIGENSGQCHFVHFTSHTDCPAIESWHPR